MKRILLIQFLLALLAFIFLKPLIIEETIKETLILWLDKIFVNLFIYFIIIDLLFALKLPELLGKFIFPIFKKLFGITNYNSAFIIISSIFVGSPVIQKYIDELVLQKLITIKEANYLVKFCSNTNIIFIINVVGVFYSLKIGIYQILSIFIANFFIALSYRSNNKENNYRVSKDKTMKFNLQDSISKNIEILFSICGIMIIFSVIISFLLNLNISYYNNIKQFLTMPLELINGINLIYESKYNINLKLLSTTFLLAFGGLSIHFQVLIAGKDFLNYRSFLKASILKSLISILIFQIIYYIF